MGKRPLNQLKELINLPEDKTTQCVDCGQRGQMEVSTAAAGFKSGAIVDNVPAWVCKCGAVYHDLKLLVLIEDMVKGKKKIGPDELLRSSWPKQL